ncbi:MAG: dihydroorotate dehydrogenase electron transfer subunit [Tannerellaceae bacterium]|jgi:dihydroorotate dehydrogenase electron transfer subunit|nr:dihydroorotate dehydrogenase electron transfer subunit [Tannerellaceae bacterium]
MDFTIVENLRHGDNHCILVLQAQESLPEIHPGQFMMLRIEASPIFLRRPFSILDADRDKNVVAILIKKAGRGSAALFNYVSGDRLNAILPLGKGFTTPRLHTDRVLLVAGGTGVAPLYFLATKLNKRPDFLVGARTFKDIPFVDKLKDVATVHLATEQEDRGFQGLVTEHPILEAQFDRVYACGPRAMLKNLADRIKNRIPFVEFSLENKMACGIGVCLCCAEKLKDGTNVRVCKEGPVFNMKELPWCH